MGRGQPANPTVETLPAASELNGISVVLQIGIWSLTLLRMIKSGKEAFIKSPLFNTEEKSLQLSTKYRATLAANDLYNAEPLHFPPLLMLAVILYMNKILLINGYFLIFSFLITGRCPFS